MHGERETGLTTFFIRHEIDTGDLLLQKRAHPRRRYAGTLSERLRHKGAQLVLRTVQMVEAGNYTPAPQRLRQPYAGTQAVQGDVRDQLGPAHQKVRTSSAPLPYPGAWTRLGDKICKIYLATPR
jgi:methionyl-tRNA formyltransferase